MTCRRSAEMRPKNIEEEGIFVNPKRTRMQEERDQAMTRAMYVARGKYKGNQHDIRFYRRSRKIVIDVNGKNKSLRTRMDLKVQ